VGHAKVFLSSDAIWIWLREVHCGCLRQTREAFGYICGAQDRLKRSNWGSSRIQNQICWRRDPRKYF